MCNASNEELYDVEAHAHFIATTFGRDENLKLKSLMQSLQIARQTNESADPFCFPDAATYGTSDEIITYIAAMLDRPFYTSVFEGDRQLMKHVFGRHPPSNDGIEITTIVRSHEQPGRICLLSIVKRISEHAWVIFDNHDT